MADELHAAPGAKAALLPLLVLLAAAALTAGCPGEEPQPVPYDVSLHVHGVGTEADAEQVRQLLEGQPGVGDVEVREGGHVLLKVDPAEGASTATVLRALDAAGYHAHEGGPH